MTKCPFLACFVLICAYGLILYTCGVLTPFSSFFSNILVLIVECSFKTTLRRLGYSLSSKWVGPHFSRATPISFKDLCSFHFHLSMTCLIMHETFKRVKWHVLTKCPFIACFVLICAYGIILSTCGVLTPFSFPFPNILGSGRWRLIWDDLKKTRIFSIIQVGRSSLFEGDANILLMKLLYFSQIFMFIPLSFEYDLYKIICGFFTFDVGLCPNCCDCLDGMRWDNLWDYLSILCICMCSKCKNPQEFIDGISMICAMEG